MGGGGARGEGYAPRKALRTSIKRQFLKILSILGDKYQQMAPRKWQRLQERGWDNPRRDFCGKRNGTPEYLLWKSPETRVVEPELGVRGGQEGATVQGSGFRASRVESRRARCGNDGPELGSARRRVGHGAGGPR